MQFSPPFCYFLIRRTNYLPQYYALEDSQTPFFQFGQLSITRIKSNIVLCIVFLHNIDPKSTRIEDVSTDKEERRRLLKEARAQKGL